VKPLAPERYGVQFSMGREDREVLERAKELLSHQIPSGDEAQVFLHALRALVRQLERRKLGAADKPRTCTARESKNPRYIPARVRRAVQERDRGRCTFVGDNGHRCEARKMLEFDHVLEIARGGRSTTDNLRLRCRTHNQYTAEQTYGPALMNAKREDAARAAAKKRAEEIIPWLQALGIRADQARRATERCEGISGASLEERVKAALRFFGPRDVQLQASAPAT
jgi:5-methylcytosine-specific restriction endonuclease McrA